MGAQLSNRGLAITFFLFMAKRNQHTPMLLTVLPSSLSFASCLVAPRANVARHKAGNQAPNHMISQLPTGPEVRVTRKKREDRKWFLKEEEENAGVCRCVS